MINTWLDDNGWLWVAHDPFLPNLFGFGKTEKRAVRSLVRQVDAVSDPTGTACAVAVRKERLPSPPPLPPFLRMS
jgi:hypothetical protein